MKFIVWVGGVPDYEGKDLKKAQEVFKEWQKKGYDDVVLEKIEEDL